MVKCPIDSTLKMKTNVRQPRHPLSMLLLPGVTL